jgi:hypothetical protein
MMTIKTIRDGNKVSLFEAKWLEYERMFYENKADFVRQYITPGREIELLMMYPPDDYSFKNGYTIDYEKPDKEDKTEFIKINFVDGDDLGRIIFVQKSRIYIMQGGQTVDTIYC